MNNTAEISLHEEYMQSAFDNVLQAEQALAEVEGRLSKAVALLKTEKALAEAEVSKAWAAINALMLETGEAEVMLPTQGGTWNKVYYTVSRESVKVDDPEAVPDEFVKIERKPQLTEIGKFLKAGNKVNWAAFQSGESKLSWKNVKKGYENE